MKRAPSVKRSHFLWELRPYFRQVAGQLVLGSLTAIFINTAVVLPAMPAFYQMPRTIDDLASFMAGKILSVLGFAHRLYPPWKDDAIAAAPVDASDATG